VTEGPGFSGADRASARRGVWISVVGGAVLAGVKASGFFLRAIFGGEIWGLYAIAWSVVELLAYLLVAGFVDAVVIFASRVLAARERGAAPEETEHYRTLSKIVLLPVLAAIALAGSLHVLAPVVYAAFWSQHDPLLIPLVRWLGWSLPLLVLVQVPAEATRAALRFGAAVGIVQIAFPLLSLGFAIGVYRYQDPSILAVGKGAILALLCCAPASLLAYSRHFSLERTLGGLFHGPSLREALGFAVPQGLNMMLGQGLNRIDGLMLSGLGVSANSIGVYNLVTEVTQVVRVGKMAFSGVYSPLVARYRASGNRDGIREALADTTQKTSAIGLALLIGAMTLWPLAVLRRGETWEESALFPWLLAAGPVMSTLFGLAGNTLLMLGHSRLLLLNAAASGLLSVALNALLIPALGVLGASLATAIASVFISSLQLFELRRFEGILVERAAYLRAVLAATPSLIVAFVATVRLLPAAGDTMLGLGPVPSRVVLAVGCLLCYAALLFLLPRAGARR